MSGPAQERFLKAVEAASAAGVAKALAAGHPSTSSCALYAAKGSDAEKRHTRHHEIFDRWFEPFIRKTESLAVSIVSWGFLFIIVIGVVIFVILATDVKPWELFHSSRREIGDIK